MASSSEGRAGHSAQRRYEALRSQRQARLSERFGPAALLVGALSSEPQSNTSWKRGAEGERRAAARLEKQLRDAGLFLLHDRAMPRSQANIDHLAVGPGGLTVIDSKLLSGKIRVERVGGLFRPRRQRLLVGGRERPNLVDGVERQVDAVRQTMGEDVDVRGCLCMVDTAALPLFQSLRVRQVPIVGPKGAARLARRQGALSPAEVAELRSRLATAFPPA